MNKQELIKAVAQRTSLTQVDVAKVFSAEEDIVHEKLEQGEKVQRTGFVIYDVAHRAARKGFDPTRETAMDIAATVGVKVSAGEGLKNVVKKAVTEGKLKVEDFAPKPKAPKAPKADK